jgi:hypothetical protein
MKENLEIPPSKIEMIARWIAIVSIGIFAIYMAGQSRNSTLEKHNIQQAQINAILEKLSEVRPKDVYEKVDTVLEKQDIILDKLER